jgi:hypothetical protein
MKDERGRTNESEEKKEEKDEKNEEKKMKPHGSNAPRARPWGQQEENSKARGNFGKPEEKSKLK